MAKERPSTALAKNAADKINAEHALAISSMVDAVEHAIGCGDLLIQQRDRMDVPKGRPKKGVARDTNFKEWVPANCAFSYEMAARYMRTYRDRVKIRAASAASLRQALRLTAKKRKRRKSPPLPKGKFDVILADPPWQYSYSQSDSRSIEAHYESMSTDDLCELEVGDRLADNAVVYLWATAPKLPEALRVADAWNLTYKTNAIWDKQIDGMGYWFRGRHELLLVLTAGDFSPPEESLRSSSIFSERRRAHSEKPEVVYSLIESLFPDGQRLEMFGRRERQDWTLWPPLTWHAQKG